MNIDSHNRSQLGDDGQGRLERWARWAAVKWRQALLVTLAVTVTTGAGLFFLRLDLTFYSIMPKDSPATADLAEIVDTFPSASTIVNVVSANPGTIREAVDAVALAYSNDEFFDHVIRVESNLDDTFLVEHGMMLLPSVQLQRLRILISAADRPSGGTPESLSTIDLRDLLALLGGSVTSHGGYYLNRTGDKALVLVQPRFTINDIGTYRRVIPEFERAAAEAAANHGATVGLTGILVIGKDEVVTSEQGLELSVTIAVLLILTLLIVAFRMWSAPIIAGIPLLLGLVWAAGLAGFFVGRLNIMTAMYMVALMGLGVDYAIHLLTAFRQHLDNDVGYVEAIISSFVVSGRGIVTGAVTTAIAFFALVVAESSIIRELGVVVGIGILSQLTAMFIVVPALLGMRAARHSRRKRRAVSRATGSGAQLKAGEPKPIGTGRAGVTIIILLAATFLLGSFAPRVQVESNLMNMEAKGLKSVELQDVMVEEFGMAPDTLSIIAEDPEEAARIVSNLETIESVSAVESIARYLPAKEVQAERAIEIARLRSLLEPIVDVGTSQIAPLAKALLPLTEDPFITLEDVPRSIRSLYMAPDGSRNLVTIVPSENLWEKEHRDSALRDIRDVSDRVTGMLLAADQLTKIAETDGVRAALAALVAIFIVLLLDFRNIYLALLNLVPLACAFVSLFGIMALVGIRFDFVNIIAVPLLIGIGIDDSVHVSHRYLYEGIGRVSEAVRLTGRAILLTTLTTLIGFGSFIPSVMRAMRSTGIVVSIAMALAYLYSILLHPSLLFLMRERLGVSFEPQWRLKRNHSSS